MGFHKRGNSHTTEHIFLHYKQTHHPGRTVLPLSRLKEVLTTLYSSTAFLSLLLPVYFTWTVSKIWSRAGQFRPPHFSQYPSQILSTNFCCHLLFCFLHSAALVACCNLQPATCYCLQPAVPTACYNLLPVTSCCTCNHLQTAMPCCMRAITFWSCHLLYLQYAALAVAPLHYCTTLILTWLYALYLNLISCF